MANTDFRMSVRSGLNEPIKGDLNDFELGMWIEDPSVTTPKIRLYTYVPGATNTVQVSVGDANTLDGFDSSEFARTNINDLNVKGDAEVFQYGLVVNGILWATAQNAKYADIAEYYETDTTYEPGDILMVGEDAECTLADGSMPLMGVCSTQPAYLMNTEIEELVDEDGEKLIKHFAPVALKGRIPVKITGSAKRGDYIILDIKKPGLGKAVKTYPKDPSKMLIGLCITAGKGTCEIKV